MAWNCNGIGKGKMTSLAVASDTMEGGRPEIVALLETGGEVPDNALSGYCT